MLGVVFSALVSMGIGHAENNHAENKPNEKDWNRGMAVREHFVGNPVFNNSDNSDNSDNKEAVGEDGEGASNVSIKNSDVSIAEMNIYNLISDIVRFKSIGIYSGGNPTQIDDSSDDGKLKTLISNKEDSKVIGISWLNDGTMDQVLAMNWLLDNWVKLWTDEGLVKNVDILHAEVLRSASENGEVCSFGDIFKDHGEGGIGVNAAADKNDKQGVSLRIVKLLFELTWQWGDGARGSLNNDNSNWFFEDNSGVVAKVNGVLKKIQDEYLKKISTALGNFTALTNAINVAVNNFKTELEKKKAELKEKKDKDENENENAEKLEEVINLVESLVNACSGLKELNENKKISTLFSKDGLSSIVKKCKAVKGAAEILNEKTGDIPQQYGEDTQKITDAIEKIKSVMEKILEKEGIVDNAGENVEKYITSGSFDGICDALGDARKLTDDLVISETSDTKNSENSSKNTTALQTDTVSTQHITGEASELVKVAESTGTNPAAAGNTIKVPSQVSPTTMNEHLKTEIEEEKAEVDEEGKPNGTISIASKIELHDASIKDPNKVTEDTDEKTKNTNNETVDSPNEESDNTTMNNIENANQSVSMSSQFPPNVTSSQPTPNSVINLNSNPVATKVPHEWNPDQHLLQNNSSGTGNNSRTNSSSAKRDSAKAGNNESGQRYNQGRKNYNNKGNRQKGQTKRKRYILLR
ncbi:MAG: hypothetical protein LBH49_02140 [Puniceicoccales bacterium]|nr:hypothetical protein [Puniceicoccales bacterium]